MKLQELVDFCYSEIEKGALDATRCPDLDDCQAEINVFEMLAVNEIIRKEKDNTTIKS